MMRIAIASLLTAVVLFFFGFLWWGVLMPIVRPAEVIGDATLIEKVAAAVEESGLYFHPDYGEPVDAESGPMAIIYFNKTPPSMPAIMGLGFAQMLVSSLLASLGLAALGWRSFGHRVAAVFFLGLFVAVWADIGNLVWWRHPAGWTAFHVGYDVLSWLLAGLLLAWLVKPTPADTSAAA